MSDFLVVEKLSKNAKVMANLPDRLIIVEPDRIRARPAI
jgi:hypothetical protein